MQTFEEIRKKYGMTAQESGNSEEKPSTTGESFADIRKCFGFTDMKVESPAAQQQGVSNGFETLRQMFGMPQAERMSGAKNMVDTYVADITDFSKNVSAAGGGMDYNNYQDIIWDYTGQREAMLQRTDELIGYLNENADLYEKESLDGMLQWLGENKTYLQTLGTVFDQQKSFYDSFTSEKEYTLYDTYKDTSAEELRELAKTEEDWETRDWMINRADALEYKAPRELNVIDAEMADLNQQIEELENDPVFSIELYKTENVPLERYLLATTKLEKLKEQRTALQTERQAAVNQAAMASLPDTVAEIDAEMEKLDREIAELESKPKTNFEKHGANTHGITSPLEHKKERRTKLEEKRQALIAEEYLKSTYDAVRKAPDFKEKSQYVPQKEKEQRWIDIMLDNYSDNASPWEDPLYEYINGNEEAGAWLSNAGANYYGPEGGALGAVFGRVTEDKSESQKMKEHEVATFNYLYATQGKAAAYAYYSALKTDLYYRDRQDRQRYWAEYAANDPAGSSIFSVVMSPMKGLAFATQTADYLADGELTKDAPYNRYLYMSKAIREEVPKNWGPVGSFAYQTGMSMLDFVTTTAVAGGNPTLAMTIMGSGAAADMTLGALDRGLSSSQAYTLGVIAGVAEALTERFSLDALLDKTALTKSALGYWLKNALAEGSEEVASSLINTVADVMVSQDKSQWAQSVQAYKDKGYSDSEAFWRAMGDQAASLGLDALGGFISGGTLAGLNIAGDLVFKGNTKNQGTPVNVQQPVEPGAVQTPAGVTNAPQVAVQNPVAAEQNPVIPERNTTVAEQTTVKTEQQAQVPSQSGEINQVINNREAMQRKLQAAEEAYKTGVISKKELQKVRREAETLNITNTIPETDRVDIDRARAAYEAGEIDEDTYYQIEDAYREQQEQLGTAPAVDEQIQYTENENQELSFAQQQRLAESQKEGANYESEEFEPTLIGNGGLVGGFIRKSVPDGGSQRTAGAGTRGEVGQLSGSAAEQKTRANPGRAAIQRRNLAENLRLDKVSSEELLPGQGTEGKKNTILPAETWDTQMQEVADRVKQETGKEVVYVLGGIEVKGKHGTKTVNGAYDGQQIIVRADHMRLTIEQIADHEVYHALIDVTGNRYKMITQLRDYILERYDADSFNRIMDKYIAGLTGIVDVTEDMSQEAWEDALLRVMEEIFADAYAGINAFGAHAEQLQEIVRPWAEENMLPQARQQSNGTRQTNGPNADARFSIETLPDGKKYVRADRQVILGSNPDSWSEQVEDYINGRIRRGQDVTLIAENGDELKLTANTAGKLADNHTGRGTTMPDEDFYIKANAAVHIDELSQISTRGETKKDLGSRHGEFASRGWNYRTAFFQDFDGKYYKLQISVAQSENGDIIYNIGKIEERSSPTIYGSSAKGGALGGKTSFEKRVPQDGRAVKEKFSVDDTEPDYRFSAADEQGSGYIDGLEIDQQEAVEELRKREEAEYAEVKEKLASGELKPREQLTTKAKNYLQKAERKLLNKIRYALSVPRVAAREHLKGTVEQLSAEFLATGRFTQETVDRLFEDAWNQGVIEDREFYETYKPVKDFLRTTAVTIRETDSHDIADYRDFKRRARYTLKIVNEGGQSVDSVYTELMDMAPGLFPADISHPADQLQQMYDVAKSITITEQNLHSIGGEYGRQMKLAAREAFEDAMQAVRADLRNVKRSADDLAERKRSEQEKPVYDSVEKVTEAYENMKKARRAADKAVANNLLTVRDEMLVGRLLRGEILVEDLNPETDNVAGITEVYEAKKAYEALAKPLVEYKKKTKAHLLSIADTFLETANSWKDKKSVLAYSRETMSRNVLDIVPDKALAKQIIEHYFEPVQKAEAQRTRFKNEMRQRVAALGLSLKVQKGNIVSETHAVQLLGEARDNIQCLENAKGYMKTRDGKTLDEWHAAIRELWEQNPNLDKDKIQNAVDAARAIYDELLRLMNEVRERFGYEPVNYHRGYFPHFQAQPDGIMAQFGRALGIDTTVATLPTSINGITHTFKPGIRWFGNTLERLGFDTTYDFVGGFDMYIEGVSDVIFHTENIQNLRALAAQIRYRTSDDGIREQIDKIKVDDRLTEAEKDTKIREVYENGKFVLNNFIKELDEYTNLLANKKSKWDRTAEDALGRTWVYRVYKQMNNMVAANMVVGNLTTPLTNLIPITQAIGRTGPLNMLRGMWDSMRNNVNLEQDGIDEMSDFLTSRRGSKLLSKTTFQKVQDAAGAYMEAVDRFTSGAVVRAAYYHNLQQGLTEQEAIHQADLFAASVMADRSKGAMPTIFASQTLKPITAFQLEVNNQLSEIFKDMPRYYSDEKKGKLILAMLAYFFGAYIFNDVFELIAGRRAAIDPMYIINELAGDVSGYQIPSLYELLSGTASFKTEKEKNVGTVVQNLASDVVSELPFSGLAGLLNSFGILDLEDAGRVPVSAALPDVIKIISALSDDEAAGEYKWHVVANELSNLMYVIPPFGGSQLLKTGKGIHALIRGGSYTVNKKGEEQLQYPIYTDTVGQAIWNGFRAVVMGKNSTGGALEWVGSKFDTFSAKHTEVYQQMVASGVKQRDAFDLINELRHIRKTDEETKKSILRRTLQNADISNDGKLLAYNGIIASKSEQDLIVALTGVEENSGAILEMLYGMQDAAGLKGEEATKAKLQVLDSSGLNAEGQLTAYYDLIAGESEKEIIVELDALGADSGSVYEAVRNIREAKLLKGDAETSAKWQAVADADLTDGQKNVLAGYLMGSTELETEKGNPTQYAKLLEARKYGLTWEQYARMKTDGMSVDKYLEYTKAGLDSNKAYELLVEIDGLEPMKGKDQIVDVQKWLEVAERPWNETMKDMALEGMMSESAYEKYREVAAAGVRTYTYVTFLYDTYGWESDTKSLQDKIIDYIHGLNLTKAQKDALYLSKYSEKNLSKTPWHK